MLGSFARSILAQLCPAAAVPSSSSRLSPARLCSPAGPSCSRPCPHHPPLITQGTIAAAADSGPELSVAEQVNQRRDKDKHSRKGSSRPKARALSGIKSPRARVKQPFTKAVAINPGNPIGKKALDPPPCVLWGCGRGISLPLLPIRTAVPAAPAAPTPGPPGVTKASFTPALGPVLHLLPWEPEGTWGAGPHAEGPAVPTSCWTRLRSAPLPTQPLAGQRGARWERGASNTLAQLARTLRGPASRFAAHQQPAPTGLGAAPRSITSSPFFSPHQDTVWLFFLPLLSLGR